MADLMQQAREQFEAWATTRGMPVHRRDFPSSERRGEYGNAYTQDCWEAWQAALRAAHQGLAMGPEPATEHRNDLRRLAEAISARLKSTWQPITTAPMDGTRIKLWDAERGQPVYGRWLDDGTQDFAPMTHWAHEDAGPAYDIELAKLFEKAAEAIAARPQEGSHA